MKALVKHSKGFTLIELLVVIAIIGLLASIILVSLNSARNRGKDARISSNVNQIRVNLETEYNGAAYPSLTGVARVLAETTIDALPASHPIRVLKDDIKTSYGNGTYGVGTGAVVITKDNVSPSTGYAIYARLPGGGTTFCIDFRGNSKSNATYPSATPVDDTVATTCQ